MEISDLPIQQDSKRTRIIAIVQALFVTVLWSSSFVIIKFGLEEIPPLTYAGLRYSIASIILLGIIFSQPKMRASLRNRSRRWWVMLFLYGCIYIAITQGTQFLALLYLPAITFSLILNLTPIIVLIFAVPWLGERPSKLETILIILGIFGVILYFLPLDFVGVSILGLFVAIMSLLANSGSAIVGRAINRVRDTPTLVVTGIMMSIGSIFLMLFSLVLEPQVSLSPISWFYILWLAIFNTALAFALWNRSMRILRAIDMTLINSTMMPQIVILSIVFLGEVPDFIDWIGLIILAISVTAVQYLQTKRVESVSKDNSL
jgi:drug/metabolite transporter (DMT)-like permease